MNCKFFLSLISLLMMGQLLAQEVYKVESYECSSSFQHYCERQFYETIEMRFKEKSWQIDFQDGSSPIDLSSKEFSTHQRVFRQVMVHRNDLWESTLYGKQSDDTQFKVRSTWTFDTAQNLLTYRSKDIQESFELSLQKVPGYFWPSIN